MPALFRRFVFALTLAFISGGALLFAAPAAHAQVVAVVNGEPITAFDISERLKLHKLGGKTTPRKEVLEELIEYKLKLQIARRADINPTTAEVERAFAVLAQRSGRAPAQFEQALTTSGVDVKKLKERIKADVAWQQYVQANPAGIAVRDADIVAMMNARGQKMLFKSIQYTMQQVIFVTRRNAPDAVRIARVKEAESLRARVASCDQVPELAREYREVVIKDRVRRLSSDLAPTLQKLLESLPDGKMTPPEPTANGIEVVAICERKEVPADISSNRELRNELLGQRLQAYEKRALEKMRATSSIQIVGEP
jgi:peptidyl-prolyl cis-trans isomerase SurA